MKIIKRTLFATLLVLSCNSVMAEKWEWVHRNFRYDYYVDVDSIKREGDKATAKTLTNAVCEAPINGNYQKTYSTAETTREFDCSDGSSKALNSILKNKKREIVSESNTPSPTTQKIFDGGTAAWAGKVCGKSYPSPVDDLKKSNLMPFSSDCLVAGVELENSSEVNAKIIRENYLDLVSFVKINGRVQGWVRTVYANQQSTANGKAYTTEDFKGMVNCEATEYAGLEAYLFDSNNKQVYYYKLAQNTQPSYQSARPGAIESDTVNLVCKLANATASAPNASKNLPKPRNTEPRIDSTGTAFGISRNQFVTNAHVVENCTALKVGGLTATVKATDTKSDLALLTVTNNGDIAKLRAGRLRQGDAVTVVGYPLNGILATGAQVTAGNVSALAGMGNDSRFIQISAPVQPGNSGGPLVDSSGNVVGVVVSKLNALKMASITGDIPQNVNFAISPLVLQAFLEANGVDYLTAPSTKNLSTADVADVAKKYTSLVECYK